MRIGITGEGKVPYHKITYLDVQGEESFFGAFDGKHEATGVRIHEDTWSEKAMSFDEVQALLGQLRGFTRTKSSGV